MRLARADINLFPRTPGQATPANIMRPVRPAPNMHFHKGIPTFRALRFKGFHATLIDACRAHHRVAAASIDAAEESSLRRGPQDFELLEGAVAVDARVHSHSPWLGVHSADIAGGAFVSPETTRPFVNGTPAHGHTGPVAAAVRPDLSRGGVPPVAPRTPGDLCRVAQSGAPGLGGVAHLDTRTPTQSRFSGAVWWGSTRPNRSRAYVQSSTGGPAGTRAE